MSGDGWAVVNANTPRSSAQRDEDWLNLWSARFGINNETLLRRTANAVEGMDSTKMHADDLSIIGAARMKRLPHRGHLEEGRAPFDVLHMDVFSVRQHEIVKSAEGKALSFQYALVIVDGFSRFPWTYFCREKTELPELLNLFFNDVGINRLHAAHFFIQHGGAPHPHLDGDAVLTAADAIAVMRRAGLQACVTSAPNTPPQNAIAERMIQTLSTDSKVKMALEKVPADIWHIAFWNSACGRACLASRLCEINGQRVYCTPFELLLGYKPDLRHMVPFWTPCRYMRLGPVEQYRGKVTQLPGEPGRVLGYAAFGLQMKGQIRRMPAYVVLGSDNSTIYFVRNVLLDERPVVQELLSAPGVGAEMRIRPRKNGPALGGLHHAPSAQSDPEPTRPGGVTVTPVPHAHGHGQVPVQRTLPGRSVEQSPPGSKDPVEHGHSPPVTPAPTSAGTGQPTPTPQERGRGTSVTPAPTSAGTAQLTPTPQERGRGTSVTPAPTSAGTAQLTPMPQEHGRGTSATPAPTSAGAGPPTPMPQEHGRGDSVEQTPGPKGPVEQTPEKGITMPEQGLDAETRQPLQTMEVEQELITLTSFPRPTYKVGDKRGRPYNDTQTLEDDDHDDGPAPDLEETPGLEDEPVDLSYDPMRRDRAVRGSTRRDQHPAVLISEEIYWLHNNDCDVEAEVVIPPYVPDLSADVLAAMTGTTKTFMGRPITTPSSYEEAMKSIHAYYWQLAMKDQLAAHARFRVYTEVLVPEHQRLVKSKWVFALKSDEHEDIVTRLRARVVGGGYSQVYMRDYVETFSPTSRPEQVRLLLCLAAAELGKLGARMEYNSEVQVLCKIDIKEAYLNSDLPENEHVFVQPPQGYVPEKSPTPGWKIAWKVLKALPGLKQAGRSWWLNVRRKLINLGYEPCESAPCLFRKMTGDGYVFLLLFVDDGIILRLGSNTQDAISDLIKGLEEDLTLSKTYDIGRFLGAQLQATPEGILMHLNTYVSDVVERFCPRRREGDQSFVTSPTPAATTINFDTRDETELTEQKAKQYQILVGSLMYASTLVRMDISYAVGELATHMQAPRACDWEMALRCVEYLAGTKSHGILFPYKHRKPLVLEAYSDSDWAGKLAAGRRSRSGWVVRYGDSPISWYSGIQKVVTQSSAEAEYVAISSAANEVVYLRNVLTFLTLPQHDATVIYEDNGAAIVWSKHYSADHSRSKHVDVRYHRIRQLQEDGHVRVEKVDTRYNNADPFTKALPRADFERHINTLMSWLLPE